MNNCDKIKKNSNQDESVVLKHYKEKNHNFNWEKFKILDRETNYHKRNTSEMLHIQMHNNTINEQEDTKNLYGPYLSTIHKMKRHISKNQRSIRKPSYLK